MYGFNSSRFKNDACINTSAASFEIRNFFFPFFTGPGRCFSGIGYVFVPSSALSSACSASSPYVKYSSLNLGFRVESNNCCAGM